MEAGLRSFDRTMPEEINRVLTDSISDLLFTTEPAANENLAREGIPGDRVHHVGNVMIAVESLIEAEPVGDVSLKGLSRPVKVFNLVRLTASR